MSDGAINGGDRVSQDVKELQEGDRVDVRLHGATRPNHAKGTVVDTDPATVAKDQIMVVLDETPRGCDNPYTTPRSSINRVLGDADE